MIAIVYIIQSNSKDPPKRKPVENLYPSWILSFSTMTMTCLYNIVIGNKIFCLIECKCKVKLQNVDQRKNLISYNINLEPNLQLFYNNVIAHLYFFSLWEKLNDITKGVRVVYIFFIRRRMIFYYIGGHKYFILGKISDMMGGWRPLVFSCGKDSC